MRQINREYARQAVRFVAACELAGIPATGRQAGKFRRGEGAALQAMRGWLRAFNGRHDAAIADAYAADRAHVLAINAMLPKPGEDATEEERSIYGEAMAAVEHAEAQVQIARGNLRELEAMHGRLHTADPEPKPEPERLGAIDLIRKSLAALAA